MRIATAFLTGVLVVASAACGDDERDNVPVADQPGPITAQEDSLDEVGVESLTWTRIDLGLGGPSLAITEGGPGLIGAGVYHEPDPEDLADAGGGPNWVQGYLDLPTFWTSPDGHEWSRVLDPDFLDLDDEIQGIAASDVGVVAVAQRHVLISPDGISWTLLPDGTIADPNWLRGVIAGGPGFVAFGGDESMNHAAVWTSPDGRTWTRVPDDTAVFGANMHAMTVGGPGLVAVGHDETTNNPVVWTSPDGHIWTRVPHDPATFGQGDPSLLYSGMRIADVVPGGPGLVAVGTDMSGVTRDELTFVAAAWTSADGRTWTRAPHDSESFEGPGPAPLAGFTDVAGIGDGFVAIGFLGEASAVWTSHDGITWSHAMAALGTTDETGFERVIAGGPGVVIVGVDVIEDYTDHRPPVHETVIWLGSSPEQRPAP